MLRIALHKDQPTNLGDMISLDTNQLLQNRPGGPFPTRTDGPFLRMLHKVAGETGHELILAEVVEMEYLARLRHVIETARRCYFKASADLHRLFPMWRTPKVPDSLREAAEQHQREQVAKIFKVYPTPDHAWREALIREAYRHPPAKTSWEASGGGARDAVIWLTLIDACRTRDEEMYFLTDNSGDFGKGELRPELAEDLDKLLSPQRHLFHYCPNIPSLMQQLGIAEFECPDAVVIGSSAPVLAAIESALTDEGPAGFEFLEGIPNATMKYVRSVDRIDDLRFVRTQERVVAYRIGESAWACARGIWSGHKPMSFMWIPELVRSARHQEVRLDFTVSATVLVQLDGDRSVIAAEVTDRDPVTIL